jgi:membrane-associated protease RseP (regulator of RpoE activity)
VTIFDQATIYLSAAALAVCASVAVLLAHEFGHLIAARWCGVKVFAIHVGFGPKLLSFTDRRGQRWQLAGLPIGGYVAFDDPTDLLCEHTAGGAIIIRDRALFYRSVLKKAAITIGGPLANLLLAVLLITAACLRTDLLARTPLQTSYSNLDIVARTAAGLLRALHLGIHETWRVVARAISPAILFLGSSGSGDLGQGSPSIYFPIDDVSWLLYLVGSFSVFVACFNMLPLLPLDGGHLAFCAAEAVRGKPISKYAKKHCSYIGFAVIIVLGLFAVANLSASI